MKLFCRSFLFVWKHLGLNRAVNRSVCMKVHFWLANVCVEPQNFNQRDRAKSCVENSVLKLHRTVCLELIDRFLCTSFDWKTREAFIGFSKHIEDCIFMFEISHCLCAFFNHCCKVIKGNPFKKNNLSRCKISSI